MRRADNLTTFMCRLSWNLGASTSWNPQGLSRSVMGLLYLYLSFEYRLPLNSMLSNSSVTVTIYKTIYQSTPRCSQETWIFNTTTQQLCKMETTTCSACWNLESAFSRVKPLHQVPLISSKTMSTITETINQQKKWQISAIKLNFLKKKSAKYQIIFSRLN